MNENQIAIYQTVEQEELENVNGGYIDPEIKKKIEKVKQIIESRKGNPSA